MADRYDTAEKGCVCGHPESEHRAEVLPFSTCHHIDGHSIYAPAVFGVAYSATPCWCSGFKKADRG